MVKDASETRKITVCELADSRNQRRAGAQHEEAVAEYGDKVEAAEERSKRLKDLEEALKSSTADKARSTQRSKRWQRRRRNRVMTPMAEKAGAA